MLLEIDTDLLDVPVVEEPPAPGVEETFPHIYGPLSAAHAVVGVTPTVTATVAHSAHQTQPQPRSGP